MLTTPGNQSKDHFSAPHRSSAAGMFVIRVADTRALGSKTLRFHRVATPGAKIQSA
jgi:hypothetical protein